MKVNAPVKSDFENSIKFKFNRKSSVNYRDFLTSYPSLFIQFLGSSFE
jgi:hypothetical protein